MATEKHIQDAELATVETAEQAASFSIEEIEMAGDEPVTVYGRMQP